MKQGLYLMARQGLRTLLSPPLKRPASRPRSRTPDFLALMKPRLLPMVLLATAIGFFLAARGVLDYPALFHALLGTALATGGTLALNQLAEQEIDARMRRTRTRPLPQGRVLPGEALLFGVAATLAGLIHLTLALNPVTGILTGLTAIFYLFCYTPLKRITSLNSVAGAVPGAMPPVIGWTAAAGGLSFEAVVLFSILFLWQLPHALAIGVLYREEFAEAGVRVLPVEEPDGKSTGRHVVNNCLALLAVSMIPTLIGMSGPRYFVAATALGLVYLGFGVHLAVERVERSARRLFYVSLLYLPLLFLAMALDMGNP